jgi:hypothetical protein
VVKLGVAEVREVELAINPEEHRSVALAAPQIKRPDSAGQAVARQRATPPLDSHAGAPARVRERLTGVGARSR